MKSGNIKDTFWGRFTSAICLIGNLIRVDWIKIFEPRLTGDEAIWFMASESMTHGSRKRWDKNQENKPATFATKVTLLEGMKARS